MGRPKSFSAVFDLKDLTSLPKLKEIKEFGSDEAQTESLSEEEQPGAVAAEEDGAGPGNDARESMPESTED